VKIRTARTAAGALLATGAMLTALGMASGCQHRDPVPPFPGATVRPAPVAGTGRPVAACDDTEGFGPCVYVDDAPDGRTHLYYVDEGGRYPDLFTRDMGVWSDDAAVLTRYVPQCRDAADAGPCVGQTGAGWVWVAPGASFPAGVPMPLCPSAAGGPAPCVWVPDVSGSGVPGDDAGVYVYGM